MLVKSYTTYISRLSLITKLAGGHDAGDPDHDDGISQRVTALYRTLNPNGKVKKLNVPRDLSRTNICSITPRPSNPDSKYTIKVAEIPIHLCVLFV